jgi:hypothetical protein
MNPQQPNQQPVPAQPTPQFAPLQQDKQPPSRKMIFLMIGGGLLLLIMLLLVIFGGKSTPGQADMKKVMQNTSDSLGILDEYQDDISFSGTKNDMALVQILLRGNLQNLNDLYKKTYNAKKSFSSTPKPDAKSKETLDSAQRDNKLDTEIIVVLKPKIREARLNLTKIKGNFTKQSSLETIDKAQTDYKAIADILDDQQ